jgi:hypothetical protein
MSGTRQKILDEQLSQTLAAEGRGEALDAEAEDAEPLMAKPAPESPALAERLMEEVCDRENLERAWQRVRSNKGSPGVDGMTIDAAKDYLREHWPDIRAQLLEGTSHGELWVKSVFIRACVKLRGLFRYPRSEPDCMTRPVSEHDQPHIRSPLETAVPTSRLRRAGAQGTKPFYQSACRAMVTIGFVHPDPPELIRSWEI